MTAAVASATQIDAHANSGKLATVGLTQEDYEILRAVSFTPSVTVNVLYTKLPMLPVSPTVISLTKRALLHRYCSVYNLTRAGWVILLAAELLISPQ